MAGRANTIDDSELSRSADRMSDVRTVIGTVEVLSIPASTLLELLFTRCYMDQTYNGKIMLDRIPPAQGCFGK